MIIKHIKSVCIIGIIGIIFVCGYLLGSSQAGTVAEVQTVVEAKEVIPDGYIPLEECIPLEDVACFFIDEYGYPCFSLKDLGYQLDDASNRSYADIMQGLVDVTEEYRNNFLDMRQVVSYTADENGLQLYFEDGSGYYLER